MSLLTEIYLGFLISITAAALLIILIYPTDRTALVVAITALLITTGKAGYEIYDKEREPKSKDQAAREKITSTARYGIWDSTGNELGVVIYNAGGNPISVASVKCHYVQNGTKKMLELSTMKHMPTELVSPKLRLSSVAAVSSMSC